MLLSRTEAEKDKVVVPLTQEDYCIKTKVQTKDDPQDFGDFYDDYDFDNDDDDDEEYSDNGGCFFSVDLFLLIYRKILINRKK